ncbi:unnamed protein product [Caenorhabditis brenneri]
MNSKLEVEELKKSFLFAYRKKFPRESSSAIAKSTITLLRKIIARESPKTLNDFQVSLNGHCRRLYGAQQSELIFINVGLMISKLARDELVQKNGAPDDKDMYVLWREEDAANENQKKMELADVKRELQVSIKELVSEIDAAREGVAAQSMELVFNNDVVMVYSLGSSKTLQAFFQHALDAGRRHKVIEIADDDEELGKGPKFGRQIQLYEAASEMEKASKLVLVAAIYFPDGTCIVPAGGEQLALLAKRRQIPVYVLAPFYKLCPINMSNPAMLHTRRGVPLPFNLSTSTGLVDCSEPAFDRLASDLVTYYVNSSSHLIPSHINTFKNNYYNCHDISEYPQ